MSKQNAGRLAAASTVGLLSMPVELTMLIWSFLPVSLVALAYGRRVCKDLATVLGVRSIAADGGLHTVSLALHVSEWDNRSNEQGEFRYRQFYDVLDVIGKHTTCVYGTVHASDLSRIIERCPSVEVLHVHVPRYFGDQPLVAPNLTSLAIASEDEYVGGWTASKCLKLPNLRRLNTALLPPIHFISLLNALNSMPHLEQLRLGNTVSDTLMRAAVHRHAGLRVLKLDTPVLTEKCAALGDSAKQLEVLDVEDASQIHSAVLQGFLRHCSGLRKLRLRFAKLTPLANVPTRLQKLYLSHCHDLNDDDVRTLMHSNPALRSLSLLMCRSLTPRAVAHVARYQTCLRVFHLWAPWLKCATELEELGHALRGVRALGLLLNVDCGILASTIVRVAPLVQYLDLSCLRISEEDVLFLAESLSFMHLVNLRECPCAAPSLLRQLKLVNPKLRVRTHLVERRTWSF